MPVLYSNQGSGNCYKVRLLLAQMEQPFELVEIDVVAGEGRTDAFLAKNPDGKVPLLQLEDDSYLAESGAILQFLANGTEYWPDSRRGQADVLRWMFFEQYSHEPNIAVARFWCHYLKAEERYHDALVEKRDKGHKALRVMERHLEQQPFFATDRYTIADIALYAYTHVAHEGGFDLQTYPAIRSWLKRVAAQPRHVPIEQRFSENPG